jgi:protein-tyrosine phosphatase
VSRSVDWEGAFNARDLGGLPLIDGGTTAYGRVYRSGRPEYLTSAGWQQAVAAGLTAVVDLRNADETARKEYDPVVDDALLAGLRRVRLATEDPDDEQFVGVCGPWLDHPRYYADNLALYPEKFAALFGFLASVDGPVLVHCAAGRDRTGMVSAMLLKLAGVDATAIGGDYELAAREVNAYLGARPGHSQERMRPADELEPWLAERCEALTDWIDGFDVAGYLQKAGLEQPQLDRLRTLLH